VLRSRSELDEKIREQLEDAQTQLGVHCEHSSITGTFSRLIRRRCKVCSVIWFFAI